MASEGQSITKMPSERYRRSVSMAFAIAAPMSRLSCFASGRDERTCSRGVIVSSNSSVYSGESRSAASGRAEYAEPTSSGIPGRGTTEAHTRLSPHHHTTRFRGSTAGGRAGAVSVEVPRAIWPVGAMPGISHRCDCSLKVLRCTGGCDEAAQARHASVRVTVDEVLRGRYCYPCHRFFSLPCAVQQEGTLPALLIRREVLRIALMRRPIQVQQAVLAPHHPVAATAVDNVRSLGRYTTHLFSLSRARCALLRHVAPQNRGFRPTKCAWNAFLHTEH